MADGVAEGLGGHTPGMRRCTSSLAALPMHLCMMGWVTHTFNLEQLILQDLSLSLHWSCKCCSACKILLSEFQTQAEHHRLPASRRARAVAKEASLAAERLQKMTLHDGCPRALNCARTHARTRARTHTHAHTNAHTRTNTHTHMRAHN